MKKKDILSYFKSKGLEYIYRHDDPNAPKWIEKEMQNRRLETLVKSACQLILTLAFVFILIKLIPTVKLTWLAILLYYQLNRLT